MYIIYVQFKAILYNEIMTLPIHEKELSGCGVTPFPSYPAFKSTVRTACQFCGAQNRNGYVLSMNTAYKKCLCAHPNSVTRKAFFARIVRFRGLDIFTYSSPHRLSRERCFNFSREMFFWFTAK